MACLVSTLFTQLIQTDKIGTYHVTNTHIQFFPGSVHNGKILRTVSLFANKFKNSYVPTRNMWLSRLYFNISNSKQKQCFTIDTRDIHDFGLGKFRTSADSGTRQICYCNRNQKRH